MLQHGRPEDRETALSWDAEVTSPFFPKRQGLQEEVVKPIEEDGFSLTSLGDRVVVMLLFEQVVDENQVRQAWRLWQQMKRSAVEEPLWRVLMLLPGLDYEQIYQIAARVHGFETAEIVRLEVIRLIQQVEQLVDASLWDEMVNLRVVPVSKVQHPKTRDIHIVFAAQNPMAQEVRRVMTRLCGENYELRYAPEKDILGLLAEALPQRYHHLAPKKEKKQATADAASGETQPPIMTPGNTATFMGWFDELLVAMFKRQVQMACLVPTAEEEVEIYFQVDGELVFQQLINHVPANLLVSTIKRNFSLLQQATEDNGKSKIIQRWIDNRAIRFKVVIVPAKEEGFTESLIIQVLG